VPEQIDDVRLSARLVRSWPGMDARAAAAGLLPAAAQLLGRPLVATERGGASDASHLATTIPLTIDGLGPRGGSAHHPDEWVSVASLRTRAEVGLAVLAAVLASP
jgi:glutamate carboxypeptidase